MIGGFVVNNRHGAIADDQNLLKMKLLSVCDSLFGNKFAPNYTNSNGVDFASSSQRSESSFDVVQPSKTSVATYCRDGDETVTETEFDESTHCLSPVSTSAFTSSPSSPLMVGTSMSSSSAISTAEVEEKVVRFGGDDDDSNFVTVHEIDHHRKEEKKLIWYRNKELKRIRKEGQATLQLLLDGELDIDADDAGDEHCLIGLESFSDMSHPYAKQRSLHKSFLYDIVMDEQKRQYEEGIYFDEEALASKVRSFTSRSQRTSFVSKLRSDIKNNQRMKKRRNQTQRRSSIVDDDDQFIDESYHQQLKHYTGASST